MFWWQNIEINIVNFTWCSLFLKCVWLINQQYLVLRSWSGSEFKIGKVTCAVVVILFSQQNSSWLLFVIKMVYIHKTFVLFFIYTSELSNLLLNCFSFLMFLLPKAWCIRIVCCCQFYALCYCWFGLILSEDIVQGLKAIKWFYLPFSFNICN